MWSDCALLLCYPVGAVILDGFGGKRREENDDDKGDLMKLINKCASIDGFS